LFYSKQNQLRLSRRKLGYLVSIMSLLPWKLITEIGFRNRKNQFRIRRDDDIIKNIDEPLDKNP